MAEAVEGLIDERTPGLLTSSKTPGLVIVVWIHGRIHVTRCFGWADIEERRPMTLGTVFRVGSMSKPVTALGILRLVEQGLVRLDDPVFSHIRSYELPPDRRGGFDLGEITVRRILSHTSRLNVHSHPWWAPGADLPTTQQLLDGIDGPACQLRIEQRPGKTAVYSGGGITLLGLMAEDVTGMPFADYMDREVLRPLGMHRSTFHQGAGLASDVATSYNAAGERRPRYSLAATAASGLFTNPLDMTKLWTALMRGEHGEPPGRGIISPKLVAEALSDQRHGAEGQTWGLGFLLYLFQQGVAYRHGGQRPGWFCHAEADGHARFSILAMSNSDNGGGVINPLVTEIRKLLATMRVTTAPSLSVADHAAQRTA